MGSGINFGLSKKTHIFHLKVWILAIIFLGIFILVFVLLMLWYNFARRKFRRCFNMPVVEKNIVDEEYCGIKGSSSESSYPTLTGSPLAGLPELSRVGWGHWFTLRDLEVATNQFSKENIIGEGGYGVVYQGQLVNGTLVAVKRLLNNSGQAEKEFRVEVEAIGQVRHKNLVRLLGYCIEGTNRMLIYEYVNNGNLYQWIHGDMSHIGHLTWERRMKILLDTAKGLAYLHEAIEPKIVHRDIKSSNVLVDEDFNAKISDFGLAKLLGAGKSHIYTSVMGTYGYVAPEYASSCMLNEKSDVYSYGVLILEALTGKDPAEDSCPAPEKNLVDWVKMMVGSQCMEEVVDTSIGKNRPSTFVFKRVLLSALRCINPNAEERPTMNQVVRMLELKAYPLPREGCGSIRQNNNSAGNGSGRNSFGIGRAENSEKER